MLTGSWPRQPKTPSDRAVQAAPTFLRACRRRWAAGVDRVDRAVDLRRVGLPARRPGRVDQMDCGDRRKDRHKDNLKGKLKADEAIAGKAAPRGRNGARWVRAAECPRKAASS